MKKMTILEATRKWVGEFNAINQSLLGRLMKHEIDNWHELTKVSVGNYAHVYGQALNTETDENEHISGEYEVVKVDGETLTIDVDGVEFEIEENEVDVQRDDYLPMWGTMWTFGEMLDEHWLRENIQTMSDCGFRIYEDDETGDLYFGIDGMGYDFYEAHWIPLYKERGLQWHDKEEEVLKAILVEIEKDEREACFDKSYCSDESWIEQHGDKTRQEGFAESMQWHNSQSLDELLEYYDDRYDYVLEKLGYEKKSN